ncbi:MAG: DUF1761 domain-containing protein [Rhodobacteraceae bacterium]|nr:DUF1761 domain-containing protein [Paracoccaceae bacterium]
MGYLAVVVAAAVGYIFGAVWYMTLSKPWIEASGIEVGADGKPVNSSMLPFILSAIAMLAVAGMMRHIFAMANIDTALKGLMSGAGIGLFFISPWIMINNAYGGRPFKLTIIDGGYAFFGCILMGLVLTLM